MYKKFQDILSTASDFLQIEDVIGLPKLLTIVGGFFLFISAYRDLLPIGTLPLSQATSKAYEKLRGSLWGLAAERLSNASSPDGILDYLATALSLKIPVYGKYAPSNKLEQISDAELRRGTFKNGANLFELTDPHQIITNLRVRRCDLRLAIRQMAESTK